MNRKHSVTQWSLALPCILVSAMWLSMETVHAGFISGREAYQGAKVIDFDKSIQGTKEMDWESKQDLNERIGRIPEHRAYFALDMGVWEVELGDVRNRTVNDHALPTTTEASDEGMGFALRYGYLGERWGWDLEYASYPSVTYVSTPALVAGSPTTYRARSAAGGVFFNMEYDCFEWERLRAYIGGGIGAVKIDTYVRILNGRQDRRDMEALRPSYRYKLGLKYQMTKHWALGLTYHSGNLGPFRMHQPVAWIERLRFKAFDHTASGPALNLIYRY